MAPSLTLLQLVRQVSGELGLGQPTVVIGSANNQTLQFLALAQRLVKDLVREHDWQRLVRTHVFQTTASLTVSADTVEGSTTLTVPDVSALGFRRVISGEGIAPFTEWDDTPSATEVVMDMPATATGTIDATFYQNNYALPEGFDRMLADTNWDRSNHWRNMGPKTSQEWQTLQGGIIATGPRERFRIRKNLVYLWPPPSTVMNIAFEYVSRYAIAADNDQTNEGVQTEFELDTDAALFPDDLMIAGLKYYFLKAKKLDFAGEMAEYAEILAVRKSQDEPTGSRSLAPNFAPDLIGPGSIPEGNWSL